MSLIPRILGVATAAYGAVVLVKPDVLARPVGMIEPNGEIGPGVRSAAALIAVRDIVAGGWMAIAPAGTPQRTAIVTRAAFDAGDALIFGVLGTSAEARRKSATIAGAWSALCALSLLTTRNPR